MLVRRVVKAVKLPVVASGGVADGFGIAALLALGAEAVQLGTRFIATPEAQSVIGFKEALVAAAEDGTPNEQADGWVGLLVERYRSISGL